MSESESPPPLVLLTGATGYIGSRLLTGLQDQHINVRCLARSPDDLPDDLASTTEVFQGDVLKPDSLSEVMTGVTTAYYLIHLMGSGAGFQELDREAAENFGLAAKAAGVQRIIYMGGLGDESDPQLSPHLRSRHEVGQILCSSGVETIEFRASVVIGNGSLSFDLIQSLTNRLPVMICPRWLATPTQPIAVSDVLDYLLAARELPPGDSRIFEIGSSDVVTYGELIQIYARLKGLRRWLVSVPLLTPYLSSLWLGLVTPASAEVGRHLIEGLKNPTVVKDDSALDAFSIRPLGVEQAMRQALEEEQS
ncbi:NAD(P)H-binding protein [Roseimaritima ulvae]|uniref:3 beta-hydroxysteroid dehydrogenase/Delta 5-->4-isomerase n=1 Tax=Roseimaritima ulvae TaxID=980254 RepID=A0A5B9QKL5_9BACT|nr:NAD(P)H-binding protein [Roseimaritima ulvae]QEG38085.1 3 beta-hydroxysteroid dehydrogenase/Delta 5-->4-isomerase [Roseimaritima ulvae]